MNEAERYLNRLGRSTFLSLWSYPGLFRQPGKELCDLLVIFGSDVLILSDKNCAFPMTGNLEQNWKRWFSRAVQASLKQLLGARRWISEYPDEVFLDSACQRPFPLPIPDQSRIRFHLIAIVHGVSPACALTHGGSGSLMLMNDIKGTPAHTTPFMIGDLNPTGDFVHVLDDTSLDLVMEGCDTVSEFTRYLVKKEHLLRDARPVFIAGEEELLAQYLVNVDEAGDHDFAIPPSAVGITMEEGLWKSFSKHPSRTRQIEANKISYFWDGLIEKFAGHALDDTQEFVGPLPSAQTADAALSGIQITERVLRFMAAENRTARRTLSEALLEMLRTTPPEMARKRVIFREDEPTYVFVLFPHRSEKTEVENRLARRNYLQAVCLVAKHLNPRALDIIGISTESGRDRDLRSEDALYFDARNWNEASEANAIALQTRLQIFLNPTLGEVKAREYPDS